MSEEPTVEHEYSRIIDTRHLPSIAVTLDADVAERRRLAARFGLSAINTFHADVRMVADGGAIVVNGRLKAAVIQPCAVSGEDFPVGIDERLALRFVPSRTTPRTAEEEIELTADDCDEIEFTGLTFDLGEAIAQSLALAIDPFATGPDADRARREHGLGGEAASGHFAALAALRKKD